MKHFKFISALCLAICLFSANDCTEKQPTFTPGQSGNQGNTNNPATPDTDPNAPKKYICLSFDDGPHYNASSNSKPPFTPVQSTSMAVLDKLEKYGARGSFFLIGKKISDNPEGAKKVIERGLSLGCDYQNHSYTHSKMGKSGTMTAAQIEEEISKTNKLIKDLTGKEPKFFRPPYLDRNDLLHETVDLCFISGVSTLDSRTETTTQMRIDAVLNDPQDGDIYLMHDFGNNYQTVDALDTIIPELQKRGFTLVTISELFEMRQNGMPPANNGVIYKNAFNANR